MEKLCRHEHVLVGCSNSSSSKAAVNYHFLRGGWDDPNCARPTRAFTGRALREHGDRPSYLRSFFSIILDPLDPNCRYVHNTTQHRGIPENAADHIDTVGRDRILPHTHRRASKENGQDLPRPPECDIADFDVIRRRLSMVLHPGQFTIELVTPCVDRTFNWQRGIDFLRRLRRLEFRVELHRSDGDANFIGEISHCVPIWTSRRS